MTRTAYIVSDFWPAPGGDASKAHWRTMGVFSGLIAAKAFAAPDSIITEHDFDAALAIHRSRVLPTDAIQNPIAA